jgi:oligopeptidase A
MALFDMRMHAEPARSDEAQCVLDEVRDEHALIRPPSYNRFQNSFSHIFAGPYDAGYYSYLWAEVLAADAWSVFQQEGVLDPVTGKRYQEAILERGGSRPMRENFRDFAGREPRNDALLKQRGILTP